MVKIYSPEPNPALKDLQGLAGRWEMEISNADFLPEQSAKVKGTVAFEWVEGSALKGRSARMGTISRRSGRNPATG